MSRRVVVALTAVGLLTAACGGSSGDGLGSGEDYSVLGALAELPPTSEDAFQVQTGDLAAAAELAGIEWPTSLDVEAMDRGIGPLTGGPVMDNWPEAEWLPVFVPLPTVTAVGGGHGALAQEFHDTAGWSVLDVDSYAEFGPPPNVFTVLSGDFDEATLEDLPEAAEGVHTVGEGEDLTTNPQETTPMSPVGQPTRMAQADGKLAVSGHTDLVQDWVGGDQEETLADHEALAALAGALDESDVVSAMFVVGGNFSLRDGHPLTQSDRLDDEAVLEQLEQRMDYLPTHAYDAVAIGWAVEDDEAVITLAYHYASEEVAEEAAGQLETLFTEGEMLHTGAPLTDFYTLDETSSDGRTATARVHVADPRTVSQVPSLLMNRDVPFLHQ